MTERLVVHLHDRIAGHLERLDDGRIGFTYTEDWRQAWFAGAAHQVSVSLPVRRRPERLDATAFVAGLLPDSARHRTLLAGELGIDDDPSDFAFISKMGRDCAGALTIVPEGEDPKRDAEGSVEWLDVAGLAEHLRSLPRRPLLVDHEEGIVLSLAGVNDKAAVVVRNGAVGLPRHGFPSTHIIKVDIPGLQDSVKTEFFCLMLAKGVGMRVPRAALHDAEDQSFMLMQRYDRRVEDRKLVRVHQEDFCQAFGVMPGRKYQRHGGPGWAECFDLMSETVNPTEARQTLLRQAAFQFFCGNPDAHAKNYSLVYGRGGTIQLSPLYDLNNAAAFAHRFKVARPIMAMLIGKQSNPDHVTADDWLDLAHECGLSGREVIAVVDGMAEEILHALPDAYDQVLRCEAVDRARDDIEDRCRRWGGQKPVPEIHMAL